MVKEFTIPEWALIILLSPIKVVTGDKLYVEGK